MFQKISKNQVNSFFVHVVLSNWGNHDVPQVKSSAQSELAADDQWASRKAAQIQRVWRRCAKKAVSGGFMGMPIPKKWRF
jgi:hypothetical protein